jgi:hypothetical protein
MDDFVVPAAKFGGKVIVSAGATAAVIATAGAATPIVAPLVGAGFYATGNYCKEQLKDAPEGFIKDFFDYSCDLSNSAGTSMITGGIGSSSNGLLSQMSNNSVRNAYETGCVGERIVAATGLVGQFSVKTMEEISDVREGCHVIKHYNHRKNGVNYDPNCLVCKGD